MDVRGALRFGSGIIARLEKKSVAVSKGASSDFPCRAESTQVATADTHAHARCIAHPYVNGKVECVGVTGTGGRVHMGRALTGSPGIDLKPRFIADGHC